MHILKGAALAASCFVFSAAPVAATEWETIENHIYYSDNDMMDFLNDNSLSMMINAQYAPHAGYPYPDDTLIMRLYTNDQTGQWLISYTTFHVPHAHQTMGYETHDTPMHRIVAHGSYFEMHSDNQGRERGFQSPSNHGLCENIHSPSWFYGSTNMIFQGLDERNNAMIYLFTGTGGMIQPATTGYIVRQEAGRGCYWMHRINQTQFSDQDQLTVSFP